jgi:hypothetical protein
LSAIRGEALRNPITGSAGFCAWAASGHAADDATAPLSSVINSRRFIKWSSLPACSANTQLIGILLDHLVGEREQITTNAIGSSSQRSNMGSPL